VLDLCLLHSPIGVGIEEEAVSATAVLEIGWSVLRPWKQLPRSSPDSGMKRRPPCALGRAPSLASTLTAFSHPNHKKP
jgi:hypothetical protein